MMSDLELLRQQLLREQAARKQAEFLLESKSKEWFDSHQTLLQFIAAPERCAGEGTDRLEKERFKQLIDAYPFPVMLSTGERNILVDANKKALQLFKCTLRDLINREMSDLIKSEPDEQHLHDTFYAIIDGKKHSLKCHYSSIQTGGVPGTLILLEDITDKNQNTPKEIPYRNLVENTSDVIFICDESGKFKYINPAGYKLTGFSEDELLHTHFFKLVRQDYQQKISGVYTFQIQNNIQSTYIEFPAICKDGRELWFGQTVDLNYNPDGSFEFLAISREVSDRVKYEKAIMRSEEKFRSIIENLELGLLEVDRNGIILKAYPQFCKLVGYSSEELVGKNPLELLVEEESRKIILQETAKRKQGSSSVYEIKLLKKDRSPIWVMISGAPYYNERNEIAGSVGIHLDITNRKHMEDELKQAKLLAENSLRSKDLFVANISHEIRTPLNAIMGMSQLLEQSQLDIKQQKFVEAISKSSENLLMIVNDLLDFSKLESGKMELNIEPHNIYEIISDVADLWQNKIEQKEIEFVRNIHIPSRQYAFDAARLSGILSNLLHNALKFTEKGKISLIIEMIKDLETTSVFRIQIEDTGIGISENQLHQIFESFVQAEPGIARKYGGTGLGLSISRNLLELMGSRLEVTSQLNVGTVFQFEINLEKRSDEMPHPSKAIINTEMLEGLNVLLVEDNHFNQMMAQSIMENWKMNIEIANNGKEALELIPDRQFDLILMDIQMPVMDGIECSEKIRHVFQLKTPILALTANAMPNDLKKYFKVGMNGFVLKPFKQHELYDSIRTVLFPKITETEHLTPVEPTIASPETSALCDLTNLIENCMGKDSFIQKMIQIAIREIGQKAEQLEEFLANDSFQEIKNSAHSLKPTIQNVAIPACLELVRSIEKGAVDNDWKAQVRQMIEQLNKLKSELHQKVKKEVI